MKRENNWNIKRNQKIDERWYSLVNGIIIKMNININWKLILNDIKWILLVVYVETHLYFFK